MARILYFSRDYTPHDHRFLSALARTPHQVFYLRLERGARALEDRALPPEVRLVRWAGGRGPARWRDGARLLRDLRRVLREVRPDIVHAGPVQRAALLTALTGFRPLVSMTWGYDLLFDAERNAAWRWATRFTLRRSDLLIADCATLRDRALAYGMAPDRVVYFPWGVDLAHFAPGEDGGLRARKGWDAPGTFVVLSNRAWEPLYGVDVVARAFVRAAQQHPGLRLLLLGGGSLATALRRIFQAGGVLDRVAFVGYVSQRDLPRYYRAADLYVSASHSDGSSISLLEALACGLPAAVSDIPGNREWITPGEAGWLFPDGEAHALADVLLTAATDRERLSAMRARARALAEARADWTKNVQHLLQAYERVLGG